MLAKSAGHVQARQTIEGTQAVAASAPWIAIAAIPVVFAVLTWAPHGDIFGLQFAFRFTGLPVILLETAFIVYAARVGFFKTGFLKSIPQWIRIWLSAMVLIALFTATFVAVEPALSLLRTTFWGVHLLFGMAVAFMRSLDETEASARLWSWVVGGLLGYLALVIMLVLSIGESADFPWIYFNLGTTHVRHIGVYSTVGIVAALILSAGSRHNGRYLVAATSLFGLTFWSGSRGSLLAVLAAVGISCALLPQIRKLRIVLALVASAAGGAALSLIHSVNQSAYGILRLAASTEAASADKLTSGRTAMWEGTVRSFLERPLLGYGESQFRFVVPEAQLSFNHPHNAFLQLLIQWGALGGLCFLVLASWLLWQMYAAARAGSTPQAAAFAVAISLLTMSMFDGILYYTYSLMMLALCAGFLLSGRSDLTRGARKLRSSGEAEAH